ncbi:unnamed protein product, partial [Ectocarpus fasciculatus]
TGQGTTSLHCLCREDNLVFIHLSWRKIRRLYRSRQPASRSKESEGIGRYQRNNASRTLSTNSRAPLVFVFGPQMGRQDHNALQRLVSTTTPFFPFPAVYLPDKRGRGLSSNVGS